MLSGELLAPGTYAVNTNGSTHLYCVGRCCGHAGEGKPCAAPGACMSMVGVVPGPDAPPPADDVPVFGNLAQLMAYATTHAGQHAREDARRAEAQALAEAAAGEPVGSPAGR